jgi:arsenical pump membrane protein
MAGSCTNGFYLHRHGIFSLHTIKICENQNFMPTHFAIASIWTLGITIIALILLRPRRIPEYVWAVAGALVLVLTRLVPLRQALGSVREGLNVYLFLSGMMLLSEVARLHGVFDWLAALAMRQARGSRLRLFALVYGVGVLVTALLSNDATAVVLTPAVLAVLRRGKIPPLPYLFACAFVANAASFVLPISNPANLVVFDNQLPPLALWLHRFLLPSALSIGTTFLMLYMHNRGDLRGGIVLEDGAPVQLDACGRRAALGILLAAAMLLLVSAAGRPLGPPTCAAALAILFAVSAPGFRGILTAVRDVSWGVLPLVAGLFVLVGALNHAGALPLAVLALHGLATWTRTASALAAAFGVGLAANLLNNLPVGLIAASAVQVAGASPTLHAAVLLGIDLGPNLSVTGSLATILWLIALRREGVEVSAGRFLRAGLLGMPLVLLLAVLALTLVR